MEDLWGSRTEEAKELGISNCDLGFYHTRNSGSLVWTIIDVLF